MLTTAMLLGLAWKSLVVAALTLALLRLARVRSAGERSMIAHAGLAALLALPAAILLLPQWTPLPASWFKIGRASCRGRVCQYVSISVVAVSLNKQTT